MLGSLAFLFMLSSSPLVFASIGSSIPMNPTIPLTAIKGTQKQPAIAQSGSYVYVVWNGKSRSNYDPYIAVSNNSGASFGAPLDLAPTANAVHLTEVAATGSNVYVVWADTTLNEIFYSYSNSYGSIGTWSTPQQLSATGVKSVSPIVAATGSYVYIAWTGTKQVMFTYSSTSGSSLSTPKNLASSLRGKNAHEASMAIAGNDVYIVFDGGGVFFTASTNNGATWPTTVQNVGIAGGREREPMVAAAGSYVYVVWTENFTKNAAAYQTFIQASPSNGKSGTWGGPLQVSHGSGKSAEPRVSAVGSYVYVMYKDRVVRSGSPSTWGIYFTKRNTNGLTGTWTNSTSIDPVTGDLSQTTNNTSWGHMDASGSGVYMVWTEQCCGQTFASPWTWNVAIAASHDNGVTFSKQNVSPDNGQDGPIPASDAPPILSSIDGKSACVAWQDSANQYSSNANSQILFRSTVPVS